MIISCFHTAAWVHSKIWVGFWPLEQSIDHPLEGIVTAQDGTGDPPVHRTLVLLQSEVHKVFLRERPLLIHTHITHLTTCCASNVLELLWLYTPQHFTQHIFKAKVCELKAALWAEVLTGPWLVGQWTSLWMLMREWHDCSVNGKDVTWRSSRFSASNTSCEFTTRSANPWRSPWEMEPDIALGGGGKIKQTYIISMLIMGIIIVIIIIIVPQQLKIFC